jgi:uncharacterized membrane protein
MSSFFKHKVPLTPADEERVLAAIRQAEAGNRGEVGVHIDQQRHKHDPIERAEHIYRKLRMDSTRDGTAVLLYLSLANRQATVFAGPGIHAAAEPGFWQAVTDIVAKGAKSGDLPGGIEQGLAMVGDLLRRHAPGEDAAGNELPDAVTTD